MAVSMASIISLAFGNITFWRFIKNENIEVFGKAASFVFMNGVPMSFWGYQSFKLYNNANNFLYEKYIKPTL